MRISDWSSDVCSSDLAPGDGPWQSFVIDEHPVTEHRMIGRRRADGPKRARRIFLARHRERVGDSKEPGKLARQCLDPGHPGLRGHHSQGIAIKKQPRSEEHTAELQSLMRSSYAVLCLTNK